jgi:hypothetical protein
VNIPRQFDSESEVPLDVIGGEKLAGSGFENEIPEPDFTEPQAANGSAGRN